MFLIFLVFIKGSAILDIELNKQFEDTVTDNNTYRIDKTDQQYYYVNLTLKNIDPEFYMIITYQQPYDPYTNKADSYIDWVRYRFNYVSQIENRTNRFQKLQPQGKSIYITTTGKSQQNYTIEVIVTTNFVCPNDCSNHGVCQLDGCKCDPFYIGNDCHQQAEQLLLNQKNTLSFQDQLQYFYISTEDQQTLDYYFYLYMECDEVAYSRKVFFELTEVLFASSDYNVQKEFEGIFFNSVDFNYNQPANVSIFQTSDKPLIMYTQSQIDSSLSIYINFGPETSNKSSTSIVIIVVPTVSGVILIIIVACCIFRRRKNQRQNTQNRQHTIAQENDHAKQFSPPVFIKQEADLVEEVLVPAQVQLSLDNCSICLEALSIRHQHKTVCKQVYLLNSHLFHKNCIIMWLEKHPDCPICRTGLKDELKLLEPQRD